MKILITGATGFVGSHLAEKFHFQGHEVYSLIRDSRKAELFSVPGILIHGALQAQGPCDFLAELPDDLQMVIHTAGVVHSMDELEFEKVNNRATQNLLTQLQAKYHSLRFIFLSSLAASGPAEFGQALPQEDDQARPISAYGESKRATEIFLEAIASDHWNIQIFRPPMVIGPRDPAMLDVFKMVENGLVLMSAPGGAKKEYSFICVHDLVDLLYAAALQEKQRGNFEIFFCSFPQTFFFGELVQEIAQRLGRSLVIPIILPGILIKWVSKFIFLMNKITPISTRLTPDKVKEILPQRWVCASKKSEDYFSFSYQWDLAKTIDVTIENYRTRTWQ